MEQSTQPKTQIVAEACLQEINKIFPRSYAAISKGVFGDGTRFITFTIGAKGEYANGIEQNDCCRMSIMFTEKGSTIEVESGSSGTIMCKPPQGSYLAYGRIKVGWRNFKAENEKDVVRKIKIYFERLHDTLSANVDNLHDRNAAIVRTKI